ncbi:MAG: PIN domain-containing protein [Anaerolineae bacterium]
MNNERLLLDTVFVQALLNQRDDYHIQAKAFLPRLRTASEVWVTEAVLVEVGNALSTLNRSGAIQFIKQAYQTTNMHVVSVNTPLLQSALQLYESRADKNWGLTDCISFVVMEQQRLDSAVTADEHFIQAGYRALLLEMKAAKR